MEVNSAKVLCVENTHNYAGGSCVPAECLEEMARLARHRGVHFHMDGARMFHAAVAMNVPVERLCHPVDSVMFCLSKGLGAPVGSMLCGGATFLLKAREMRKRLGGNLRQAGVLAAPGIYALTHNIPRLREDHDNAKAFATEVQRQCVYARVVPPQTNIVLLSLEESQQRLMLERLKENGVLVHRTPGAVHRTPGAVRFTFHLGISAEDALRAARLVADCLNWMMEETR